MEGAESWRPRVGWGGGNGGKRIQETPGPFLLGHHSLQGRDASGGVGSAGKDGRPERSIRQEETANGVVGVLV